MKKSYFFISNKKTYCQVSFQECGIFVEVFIPRKNITLTTKHGKWSPHYQVIGTRASVDNRKWIVSIIVGYDAIASVGSAWNGCLYYVPVVETILNDAIKY